jgi:hypothetical protein
MKILRRTRKRSRLCSMEDVLNRHKVVVNQWLVLLKFTDFTGYDCNEIAVIIEA